MKAPRLNRIASAVMLTLAAMATPPAVADDTALFRRNVSKTASKETDAANVKLMYFYVRAQNADGVLVTGLPYIAPVDLPDTFSDTIDPTTLYLYRDEAKPLVSVFTDGYVAHVDGTGFSGHGQRDAFVAISLDDGNTWTKANLSKSAAKSSFQVDTPVTLWDGTVTTDYPGDVTAVHSAIAANKILVAWQSRYCTLGYPAYLLAPSDGSAATLNNGISDIVYQDLFDVRGVQHSVDYATASFVTEAADEAVGEVPFNCLWTARGQMYTREDGRTGILWTAPERLTSGTRDLNRIELTANRGGFALTWQEDPEGLVPRGGEDAGEAWSGAVGNPETDIWYSYVTYEDFGYIDTNPTDGVPTAQVVDLANLPTTPPRAGVLFSIPVRLTDNARCVPVGDDPYCYADLDGDGDTMDLCSATAWVEDADGGSEVVEVCVAEDGRPMIGQTAATRSRLQSMVAFSVDGTGYRDWVAVNYEETKALGEIDENSDGIPDETGKNVRHQTFELRTPTRVRQGFQLNQPSTYWNETWAADLLVGANSTITTRGYRIFDSANTFGWPLYDAEDARNAATTVNITPLTGLRTLNIRGSMVALYKEGLIEGGPADAMGRRWQVGTKFDPQKNNPYSPGFVTCRWPDNTDGWIYDPDDGVIDNIHYLEGLCGAPAYNVSATIPEVCEDAAGNPVDCAYDAADALDAAAFPRALVWNQTVAETRVNSWLNPYEVAKDHRAYLDGDFLMVLYAWSPNWKLLADGLDHHNLYVRRSFTVGNTWTTTPNLIYGGDGTTTCENYLDGTYECIHYGHSAFEKARNVSQLLYLRDTVLDSRLSPTASLMGGTWDPSYNLVGLNLVDDAAYADDVRQRGKFFAAFETGKATYRDAEGQPHPWNIYDSRAYNWGDDYYLVSAYSGALGFFDSLEAAKLTYSSGVAMTPNPAGIYLYTMWNQWAYDTELPAADSVTINSDPIFRKVLFFFPTLFEDPRTGTGTNPVGAGVTE